MTEAPNGRKGEYERQHEREYECTTITPNVTDEIELEYDVAVFAGAPGAPDKGETEPVHRDTPNYRTLDGATTREGIQLADELGFDAAWAPDHFGLAGATPSTSAGPCSRRSPRRPR